MQDQVLDSETQAWLEEVRQDAVKFNTQFAIDLTKVDAYLRTQYGDSMTPCYKDSSNEDGTLTSDTAEGLAMIEYWGLETAKKFVPSELFFSLTGKLIGDLTDQQYSLNVQYEIEVELWHF